MSFRRLRYRMSACVAAGILCILLVGKAAAAELRTPVTSGQSHIARSERFVAAEAFAVGGRIGDHAVIAVGFNFVRHFYPLVETDAAAIPLDTWTLGRSADDATLIAMAGGEKEVAASLSAIYRLMALSGRGDNHTDGKSNFAYARSPVDGRLWAIHWTMSAGEWIVGAVTVPHPDLDWPGGSRLFAPRIGDDKAFRSQCAARLRVACIGRP